MKELAIAIAVGAGICVFVGGGMIAFGTYREAQVKESFAKQNRRMKERYGPPIRECLMNGGIPVAAPTPGGYFDGVACAAPLEPLVFPKDEQ